MKTTTLLGTLTAKVKEIESQARAWREADTTTLNFRRSPNSWSVLQCIEHLNQYARYYLPAIEGAIKKSSESLPVEEIKYSWIGAYSIKMMHPDNRKKQKTFRHMQPSESKLTSTVIDEFINHQEKLSDLLRLASQVDMNQGKVPVEFFRLLKMKIGESLEFVIVHEQRHMLQASEVLKASTGHRPPVLAL